MLHNKLLLRSIFLLFVSLFFYFKTSGLFVLMLIFAIVFNFFTARRIEKVETAIKKKIYLIFSVVIDLSVLFYFKYAYFFTDIYNNLFSTNNQIINYLAQWSNNLTGTHFTVDVILLPVGISFFTFQIISYVVDVYRGRLKAVTNIFDFGFYVSFFPQLVADLLWEPMFSFLRFVKNFSLAKNNSALLCFGYWTECWKNDTQRLYCG